MKGKREKTRENYEENKTRKIGKQWKKGGSNGKKREAVGKRGKQWEKREAEGKRGKQW